MMMISILSCILLFSSEVFSEQELSMFTDNKCNPETSSWTPWYNTQNPKKNSLFPIISQPSINDNNHICSSSSTCRASK